MKVLILDNAGEGCGVDLAVRARDADHDVRLWLPPFKNGDRRPYGDRMVDKPRDYRPSMAWAELIVLTGNTDYMDELTPYFGKGYPIFGANPKGAELECDREKGQEILKRHGIETIPYTVVGSAQEAVDLILETKRPYAMKPWGGESDKSMTYVAKSPDDAIFTIGRWEKEGKFKGQLMMQEKRSGVEVGISGMFGPAGWCAAYEESFEHKKFMNDELGENTGEMGTVIRHTMNSKLFDKILDPITDYLHQINYVGDCSVNCIVDAEGNPWPLEFTMRLGWPDFCIRQALIEGDPVEWMADLIHAKDSFRVSRGVAVGVCLTHGDFPRGGPADFRPKDPLDTWVGYPVYGVGDESNIHWQQAMVGPAEMILDGKLEPVTRVLTAGNYVVVVTGTGRTVEEAQTEAYNLAWSLHIPSNLMFRTDIGKRLEHDLEALQQHGYARGMRYA